MVANQASQQDSRFYEIKLTLSNWVKRVHCSDNSTSLDKISNKYHIVRTLFLTFGELARIAWNTCASRFHSNSSL